MKSEKWKVKSEYGLCNLGLSIYYYLYELIVEKNEPAIRYSLFTIRSFVKKIFRRNNEQLIANSE